MSIQISWVIDPVFGAAEGKTAAGTKIHIIDFDGMWVWQVDAKNGSKSGTSNGTHEARHLAAEAVELLETGT